MIYVLNFLMFNFHALAFPAYQTEIGAIKMYAVQGPNKATAVRTYNYLKKVKNRTLIVS